MVEWPDDIDEVIGGDLTAAVAYCTPAGGAVVTAVAPIGLRDREAGTVGFTTSLGFGKKLERIQQNPHVALAYHDRRHGFSNSSEYVLVQGKATAVLEPDRDFVENEIGPRAERFMGKPKRGKIFWDRWLQQYYADRVPVTVKVERIIAWPDEHAAGEPRVFGSPLPTDPPPPQAEPRGGVGPRLDTARLARRIAALPNQQLAWVGADGFPDVRPIKMEDGNEARLLLAASRLLPPGGRRAGLLAHHYNAQLIGLEARGCTGWMVVGDDGRSARYHPHTEFGFRAPSNKTVLLLVNGLLAKRGLRKARRQAASASA